MHRKRLEQLKLDGYGRLSAKDRFKRAGMDAEYRSIYALESSEVHSDLSNLFRSHLTHADGEIEIHLYKQRPAEEFEAPLVSTSKLLLNASMILHERLGSEAKTDLLALASEYDERYTTLSSQE